MSESRGAAKVHTEEQIRQPVALEIVPQADSTPIEKQHGTVNGPGGSRIARIAMLCAQLDAVIDGQVQHAIEKRVHPSGNILRDTVDGRPQVDDAHEPVQIHFITNEIADDE